MSAAAKSGKKRSARPAGKKRPPPKAARPRARNSRAREPLKRQSGTRAAFSIALSLFALPMAVAGLMVPLPAGLAAVLMAGIALIAGRGRKWPVRIALAALVLGVCGLIGGLVIGLTVTAPA
ncbi:MAG: hypothetical protein F4160_08765 [Rhodospirillaceae bacterium]|nr:hypothetical protein [Rhodospirillaceae bacterium]MYH36878.1 hypothetical protein [Rhodospirillaceae bacterium]